MFVIEPLRLVNRIKLLMLLKDCCWQQTWSRKLLPSVMYSEGYVANIDAVSFGPNTVNTPPLYCIIASKTGTEVMI